MFSYTKLLIVVAFGFAAAMIACDLSYPAKAPAHAVDQMIESPIHNDTAGATKSLKDMGRCNGINDGCGA
jgi:hypothetical protein